MPPCSIIIPVRNESTFLKQHLDTLKNLISNGNEVIVVDGGSQDDTVTICNNIGCKVLITKPSRGFQQHFGAQQSSHDVLLFLHADTILPANALHEVHQTLTNSNKDWGRFNVSFSNQNLIYKIIAWLMNKRSCLTGIVTGDHVLFITRHLYFESGGFSNIPLMEDVELSKRLKSYSKPICLNKYVITSSRKWENNGVINTIFKMWSLRALFFFGVPSKKLVKLYYS